MFFGRNLHLIAPFEAFLTGFCTEFCCASFVFSRPGADFWTPGRNLGPPDQILGFPGRHFGPGTFLGDFGVPKNMVLRGKDFLVRIQGNPPHPNELYGPEDPFGCATLTKTIFVCQMLCNLIFSRKSGNAPGALPVYLLFPFVGCPIPYELPIHHCGGHYLYVFQHFGPTEFLFRWNAIRWSGSK